MRSARYSLKPITVATLLTLSLSANAAVNYPTGDLSIDSTIENQYPTNINWAPVCEGDKCKKYDGTNTGALEEFRNPGEGDHSPAANSFGFYYGEKTENLAGHTVIVTSFDQLTGVVFSSSNHNIKIHSPGDMADGFANNNLLIIDTDPHQVFDVEGTNQFGQGGTITAVSNSKGGASNNGTYIRNLHSNIKDFGTTTQGPRWHVNAATVNYVTSDISNNTVVIENSFLKSERKADDLRIGASFGDNGGESANSYRIDNNNVWISNSDLDATHIYAAWVNGFETTNAVNNSVFIADSVITAYADGSGLGARGIDGIVGAVSGSKAWTEVRNTTINLEGSGSYIVSGVRGASNLANDNVVILDSVNVNNSSDGYFALYGGAANKKGSEASGNSVFVNQLSVQGELRVFGGLLNGSSADTINNIVNIRNTEVLGNKKATLVGSRAFGDGNANLSNNSLIIENSTFSGNVDVYAAQSQTATGGIADSNNLLISGVEVSGTSLIYGVQLLNGTIQNNILKIEDSKLGANSVLVGGMSPNTSSIVKNNTLHIGANVTDIGGGRLSLQNLLPSYNGFDSLETGFEGNRLIVESAVDAAVFGLAQHFDFVLSDSIDKDQAMLTVAANPIYFVTSSEGNNAGKQTTVSLSGVSIKAGDKIKLINSAGGFLNYDFDTKTSEALADGTYNNLIDNDVQVKNIVSIARVQNLSLTSDDYDLVIENGGKELNAVINELPDVVPPGEGGTDFPKPDAVNPATDALMESSLSVAASLFSADDLLIESALKSRNSARMDGPFAAARAGTWNYDTKTRLEADVYSALLGWNINMESLSFGPFIEIGHANYDTRTSVDGASQSGSGRHNYVGAGVYGNWQTPFYVRLTGYLKGGVLENHYGVNLLGQATDFDRSSGYWGAHVGAHFDLALTDNLRARPFVSYFYDGREKETYNQAAIGEAKGATFAYDALNLHRVQVGSLFEYAYSETARPYFGITYEHVIKGKAEGSARDHEGELTLNASDIEGGTGIITAGWSYLNTPKDFELNLGVNGYVGTRNGVSAQMSANWLF